ncbi:glycosyltransferase family 29 protein [Pacificibacter marinus]|uniref:glycosyltransferase family 29 protein n=1 Tax=Pacificibacter marinus TaxID=658057 RepID=UPI001C067C41|nr:glycosyltransferase family 29 protein [Pacificibacter marinus]MBU2865363.1 glycosyltransferase family 29 protein [Pacificibacter marinus]
MIVGQRLLFWVRKTLFGEQFLSSCSISQDEFFHDLMHQTVAIVGNSRGLREREFGGAIDAHDIVIRLNDAPITSAVSHGNRTDWMAVAKRVSLTKLRSRSPKLLIWMPTKRKRLSWHMIAFSRFYLNNQDRNQTLKSILGAPPSVGCMVIDLVGKSGASKVSLYGFDFFKSQSLSGNRTAAQVPHDFDAERDFIEALLETDRRFHLNR